MILYPRVVLCPTVMWNISCAEGSRCVIWTTFTLIAYADWLVLTCHFERFFSGRSHYCCAESIGCPWRWKQESNYSPHFFLTLISCFPLTDSCWYWKVSSLQFSILQFSGKLKNSQLFKVHMWLMWTFNLKMFELSVKKGQTKWCRTRQS